MHEFVPAHPNSLSGPTATRLEPSKFVFMFVSLSLCTGVFVRYSVFYIPHISDMWRLLSSDLLFLWVSNIPFCLCTRQLLYPVIF